MSFTTKTRQARMSAAQLVIMTSIVNFTRIPRFQMLFISGFFFGGIRGDWFRHLQELGADLQTTRFNRGGVHFETNLAAIFDEIDHAATMGEALLVAHHQDRLVAERLK